MGDWPIGLSTGSFYRTDIVACLERVRDAGFGLIEVCSSPSHLDFHDRHAVERAARRISDLSLECYSFHAPFHPALDITSPETSVRRPAIEEMRSAAYAAALLGSRHFVVHPGPENDGGLRTQRLERMDNAAAALLEVDQICQELGVHLVLENMLPHLFAGHVRELLWLLGALETTRVGVCLDTGHAFLSGDLQTVAHKLSGHLWMVHASDTHGVHDDHLTPGDGRVPWEALLRQLASVGFRGTFILELNGDTDADQILADAQRGRRFLRDLAHRIDRG